MNAIPKLEATTKLIVNGEEKASVVKTLSISASVALNNVQSRIIHDNRGGFQHSGRRRPEHRN